MLGLSFYFTTVRDLLTLVLSRFALTTAVSRRVHIAVAMVGWGGLGRKVPFKDFYIAFLILGQLCTDGATIRMDEQHQKQGEKQPEQQETEHEQQQQQQGQCGHEMQQETHEQHVHEQMQQPHPQLLSEDRQVTCILHLDTAGAEDPSGMKVIDNDRWNKISEIVGRRKESWKVTKYDQLVANFPSTKLPHYGYHSSCYKNFSAVPKVPKESTTSSEASTSSGKQTRAETSKLRGTTSGTLKHNCIFCGHLRHKSKYPVWSLDPAAEAKIRKAAREKDDRKLLLIIGDYLFGDGPDFTNQEVKYHKECYTAYLNTVRPPKEQEISKLKKKASKQLLAYVQNVVIGKNTPVLASSLMRVYQDSFITYGGEKEVLENYSVQNLLKKLNKHFQHQIKAESYQGKTNSIVFNSNMSYDKAVSLVVLEDQDKISINLCAHILRKEILTLKKNPLDTSSVVGIMKGEVDIPENVKHFYKKLYSGPRDNTISAQRQRFIDSSAADAVYCCSGTKLLPGKHISHALALKSMTGSKRVLTLEQRNGHCASSETVRRIDMGLEEGILSSVSNSFIPDGLNTDEEVFLAWDNWDINIETLSGSGTIHHTFGIACQNKSAPVEFHIQSPANSGRKFTKVSSNISNSTIEPYYKKPKISHHDFEVTEFFPPSSFTTKGRCYTLWTLAKSLFKEEVPMWHGWNYLHEVDINPEQNVLYMQHVELPPTRNDVVRETLRRSQLVSAACHQEYTVVTYDLAVAKLAKQIQDAESPEFDKVFIMFGSFHTEMAFFGALGRIIEGSGGPYVLTEVNIVAAGSLNKYLKGKMYNRCRRGHILFSTALHSLHFQRFIQDNEFTEETKAVLKQWVSSEDIDVIDPVLETLALKYSLYCDDTLRGVRGKTAQYWIIYCHLMDLFLLSHGSMKCCDVDLYTYVIHVISAIFYSTNHPNYARWITRFSLEMLNLNPTLKRMLMNGGLSIRRSSHHFSRVGVDMALEQTINAEAKNRLKGIIAYADINTAVNRWLVTNTMRTEITNQVLNLAGMGHNDDENFNKMNSPTRLKRDEEDLQNISSSIRDMINPFDPLINKDALFNIKTGRKAAPAAEEYLLTVITEGENRRDAFIKECNEDPYRFEKPIKKTKIVNFATESFAKKNKSKKANEIVQLRGTRDLFARLLYLSVAEKGFSEEVIMSYPLTHAPAEFVHPDRTIRSTPKSSVKALFDCVDGSPNYVDNVIVDGMFHLRHLTVPLPHTLRGLVRHIMIKVMNMSKNRVDLVFDTYNSPCMKDIARDARGDDLDDSDEVYNFGAGQKTPTNFLTLLKYSNFKKEFLCFFYNEMRNQEYADIIGHKTLYCSVDNDCIFLYCDDEGVLHTTDVPELHGAHDEADTRVVFHAMHAEAQGPGSTVVRCNDTDILVIFLANIHKFTETSIWLDAGLDHDCSRVMIDVKATAEKMDYLKALPGIYAFTGCDYTPAFFRKGKKRPFNLMIKSAKYSEIFGKFGEEELTDDDIKIVESYVCSMFGYHKLNSINEARLIHFKSKCKPKETAKPLDSLKNVDPSSFPPCKAVLLQQIRRAWFTARLYKNASSADPSADFSVLDYGFELIDGYIHVRFFEGPQVPSELDEDDDYQVNQDEGDEEGLGPEDLEDDEVSDDEDSEDEVDDNEDEELDIE